MKNPLEMTIAEYKQMVHEDWGKAINFDFDIGELIENGIEKHQCKTNQTTIDLAKKYISLGDYREANDFLDSIDRWIKPKGCEVHLTDIQKKDMANLRKEIAEGCIWGLLVAADDYLQKARTSNPDFIIRASEAYHRAKELAEKANMPLPNYLHAPGRCESIIGQAILGSEYVGLREEIIIEHLRQLPELLKEF
ncbi:MAG: hypothetical protein Q8O89_06600 [Nanoarchaeota archaeon]|nr:hypothetical protein [Nanoarchaeota archaeon]